MKTCSECKRVIIGSDTPFGGNSTVRLCPKHAAVDESIEALAAVLASKHPHYIISLQSECACVVHDDARKLLASLAVKPHKTSLSPYDLEAMHKTLKRRQP